MKYVICTNETFVANSRPLKETTTLKKAQEQIYLLYEIFSYSNK